MKTLFTFFATCILGIHVHAQTIQLRDYKVGEQINDTIYKYYGSLTSSGIGKIDFTGDLSSELLTGVSFKMVIDSINNGDSPVNPARAIINGESVALKKKDTLTLPADFRLYAGKIGFHILVHGKPVTLNQEYFCGLNIMFTTGADYEMYIMEEASKICSVEVKNDLSTRTKNKLYNSVFTVYPNPSKDEITLNVSTEMIGLTYGISNSVGKVVTSGTIADERSLVSLNDLVPGVYYVFIENAAPLKIIKQ
jgi:hypothetical protein